jgi:hypothetical protein
MLRCVRVGKRRHCDGVIHPLACALLGTVPEIQLHAYSRGSLQPSMPVIGYPDRSDAILMFKACVYICR